MNAHPLTVASAARSEPAPRNQHIPVYLGDLALTAECSVSGRYSPAVTQADPEYCHPEECPEVEIVRLWLSAPWRDVSGLLEHTFIAEDVQEQCDQYVAERENDGPDPDEAYERRRDLQTERAP